MDSSDFDWAYREISLLLATEMKRRMQAVLWDANVIPDCKRVYGMQTYLEGISLRHFHILRIYAVGIDNVIEMIDDIIVAANAVGGSRY